MRVGSKDSTAKVVIWLALALHRAGGIGAHHEAGVERLPHGAGDEDVDAVDARERLHARRDVHGLPMTVNSMRRSLPITPATTSPVWIPTPNASGASPRARELLVVGASASRIASAALTASACLPRVVLQRAEQGHQAVAHQPRQVAVVRDERPVHRAKVAVEHPTTRRLDPLATAA